MIPEYGTAAIERIIPKESGMSHKSSLLIFHIGIFSSSAGESVLYNREIMSVDSLGRLKCACEEMVWTLFVPLSSLVTQGSLQSLLRVGCLLSSVNLYQAEIIDF